MRLKIITFLGLVLIGMSVYAQKGIFEENSVVYRRQIAGGIIGYTNGLGLNYGWGKHVDGFKRRMYHVELTNLRHHKEIKSFNPIYDNARGYVFGKMNSVLVMRGTWGMKTVKFDKLRAEGVQISYNWAVGPALALLKPVYYEIGVSEDSSGFRFDYLVEEKFDADRHNVNNIFGRASFFQGVNEISVMPGIHAKFGLNFEYSPDRVGIRALEVGLAMDAYLSRLKIMATEENRQVYFNFYLNLLFGKKFID